jgi:hypothetical protein
MNPRFSLLAPALLTDTMGRRAFLQRFTAGAAGGCSLGWGSTFALRAAEMRKQGMAMILLWMGGGPSQHESFDPRPKGHPNAGPTEPMSTSVPGLEIASGWKQVAKAMDDVAVIRSMTSVEQDHPRATYHLTRGYRPDGSSKHPAFGSIAAAELGAADSDLPHFVMVGFESVPNGGFLGEQFAPFWVRHAASRPPNIQPNGGIGPQRFADRVNLRQELESDYAKEHQLLVQNDQQLMQTAKRLVVTPRQKAFDITYEPDKLRDRYGRNPFGEGCLLARRLVESGVTCVSVALQGWDTHANNFTGTGALVDKADPALAALLTDLKERGLLEKTLVAWMGEFGRTPRISRLNGRDHYPAVYSVALAGGGVKGGRAIGASDANGAAVAKRPVTVPDLFCTFCHVLKINPRKRNHDGGGRPVSIVDGGEPVMELFS